MPVPTRTTLSASLIALLSLGCSGRQSTLDVAGVEAERIARLFWWMLYGSIAIWVFVVGLTLYAVYFARRPKSEHFGRALIVGGGVVFPTAVVGAVLAYGLAMLPDFLEAAPPGSVRIQVSGEQWWWRVRYFGPSGEPVDLANEVRLPAGEAVQLELESPDVIHSFWIPSLGGKVDMIPGRKTRLRLRPTRTGTFRGACAEYCGTAHALMAFPVVVQEPREFAAWLEAQAAPAVPAQEPLAQRGQALFFESGCGACHAIRGTSADGVVGPDLTHVGGRLSIGAGTLDNTASDFHRWLERTNDVKPGVHMPAFGMLAARDLGALAAYLESLK